MPVNIDEITAEVTPPDENPEQPPAAGETQPRPSDVRFQRELFERLRQRLRVSSPIKPHHRAANGAIRRERLTSD